MLKEKLKTSIISRFDSYIYNVNNLKLNLVEEGNSSLGLTSEMLLKEGISECTQKPKVFDEAEVSLPLM